MKILLQLGYTSRYRFEQDMSKLTLAGIQQVTAQMHGNESVLTFPWPKPFLVVADGNMNLVRLPIPYNGGGSIEVNPDVVRVIAR